MMNPSSVFFSPQLSGQRRSQRGTTLIEVLVTLIILMIGLLGLVGLMVQSQRGQIESYQRVQALVIMQDMVNRINTNRKAAICYVTTTVPADGTPFIGTNGSGFAMPPACATGTLAQRDTADRDLAQWQDLLLGNAETSGGTGVGAMIGARGCVNVVATGVYRVTVSWQGQGGTRAPPFASANSAVNVPCARNLYNPAGDINDNLLRDNLRRAVYQDIQIVDLLG